MSSQHEIAAPAKVQPQPEGQEKEAPSLQLQRNPNSPSGQYGMPALQRQAAPGNVIQKKPSTEVPDLEEDVVTDLNKFIAAKDHQGALDCMLKALEKKDPATFDSKMLQGGKMKPIGGTSNTGIGTKTQTWLKKELEKGPKDIKTDEKACRKYLDGLAVPNDELQIRIEISTEALNSAANIYTTVRHEFIHFQQIKKAPLKYISSSDFPSGFANPSQSTDVALMEVEAYLWEAENIANTGADKDPWLLWNNYIHLNEKWGGTVKTESATLKPRFLAAMETVWEKALDGYLVKAEALIKAAGTGAMDAKAVTALNDAMNYIGDLWAYRGNYSAKEKTYQPRVEAVKKYQKDAEASKADAEFPTKLADAVKKFKSASSDYDGYNVWNRLVKDWKALSPTGQKKYEADYAKEVVPIWTGSFDMLDKDMTATYAKDKDDSNLVGEANAMNKMVDQAADSKIDDKTLAPRKKILDAWIKKLGLR
jgi:hypothetical protein